MHILIRASAIAAITGILGCGSIFPETSFDADRAFAHLKAQVAFGPRVPGNEAHSKTRDYLIRELKSYGLEVEEIPFLAKTPKGEVKMTNLVATLPGRKKSSIVLGSHFDTKQIPSGNCPGANDGASSTGLLLELARALKHRGPSAVTYRFVFFDGEEAYEEWSETDSLYGSRDLVQRWSKDGTIGDVKAMILFDLIGDKDLGIVRESLSSSWLVEAFRAAANDLGYEKHFFQSSESLDDDHRSFLAAGIPSIDLIDPSYGARSGPGLGSYWHSAQDTVENCSAQSLKIVGETALRALEAIEERVP